MAGRSDCLARSRLLGNPFVPAGQHHLLTTNYQLIFLKSNETTLVPENAGSSGNGHEKPVFFRRSSVTHDVIAWPAITSPTHKLASSFGLQRNHNQVNRCLARDSLRATTTNQTTNRAPNDQARPICAQESIFWGKNGRFWPNIKQESKVLVPTYQKTT